MKKAIALLVAAMLLTGLSACGGSTTADAPAKSDGTSKTETNKEEPKPQPADLTGTWKQTNSNDPSSYMEATISGDTIEVDWIGTDTSARAISLAPLDEAPDETALAAAGVSERLREALETSGRQVWLATQVLEDPDGDHDWRLTALVDLAECDREGRAVIHLLSVGPQQG